MPDLGNAAMLVAALYGIIQLVKTFVYGTTKDRVTAGIVLGSAVAATFLIGASVWAHEQVVGGQPLDKISVASKIVVAVFLAGIASTLHTTFSTAKEIGQNQPTKIQAQVLDDSAVRLMALNAAAAPKAAETATVASADAAAPRFDHPTPAV